MNVVKTLASNLRAWGAVGGGPTPPTVFPGSSKSTMKYKLTRLPATASQGEFLRRWDPRALGGCPDKLVLKARHPIFPIINSAAQNNYSDYHSRGDAPRV